MSASSKPSPLLLPVALLVCAAGLTAMGVTIASVASRVQHDRAYAAPIHLPTLEDSLHAPGMAGRGQSVFAAQFCAGCHGKLLEGGEGPCLTDAAWRKGGKATDILKSINEGSPEHGMPPFVQLPEADKAALIAFIRSRAQGLRDVSYQTYDIKGDAKTLPNFDALTAVRQGKLADDQRISAALPGKQDHYGVVYRGQIKAPTSGAYTFRLAASTGASLRLDGQPVVEAFNEKQAKEVVLDLTAGDHAFDLRYLQTKGAPKLNLEWSGPESAGFLTEPLLDPEQLLVTHTAIVVRTEVGKPTRSRTLAIGLPAVTPGQAQSHCAYDANLGMLTLGWHGEFLNTSGVWRGWCNRGGDPNAPLGGPVVKLARVPLLRLKDHPEEVPRFMGYQIQGKQVALLLELQGVPFQVTLGVMPQDQGKGVRAQIHFKNPPPGALLLADGKGATREVPKDQARECVVDFSF